MFPKQARAGILDEFMRFSTMQMHLVKAAPGGADDDMTLAALLLLEADYAGYAAQAIPDPGAAVIDGLAQATDTTATMTFQPVGLAGPQTIYGYWLDYVPRGGGPRQLWEWVRLTTPSVMVSDASQFIRQITMDVQTYNP